MIYINDGVNDNIVNVDKFPDRTSQVWNLSDNIINFVIKNVEIEVRWEFENEGEIFHLIQLADLINQVNKNQPRRQLTLYCPFLPYGRQDKQISNKTTFALHSFLNLMFEFFDYIKTVDAHSDLGAKILDDGFINISPKPFIEFAIQACDCTAICYPDESAQNRYGQMFKKYKSIVIKKVRNQKTGEIEGLDFISRPLRIDKENILIVDDLADGGATFKFASRLLYKNDEPNSVNLYVSHGLFTKGLSGLYDSGIAKIYDKNGLVTHSEIDKPSFTF